MPVIRNPFRKTASTVHHHHSAASSVEKLSDPLSASDTPTTDATPVSAVAIKNDDDKNSYKMSVVNDSGIYLPPSPSEKKSFWRREMATSSSAKNRPPIVVPIDEPFAISRESFDSYRRSFDISARSPIETTSGRQSFDIRDRPSGRSSMDVPTSRMSLDARPSRMSLDVRPAPRMSLDSRPRQSLDQRPSPRMPAVEEPYDGFEEVKLDDPRPVKKMSLFSRFGGDHAAKDGAASRPKSGIFNRKDSSEHESELNRVAKEDK